MDSAPRAMLPTLLARATRHPTLTVTGPRQSGKTTLCRMAFPHLQYVNLEDPTSRSLAVVRHAEWTCSFTHDGTIPLVQARA